MSIIESYCLWSMQTAEASNFSDEVYCGILADFWCIYLLQIVQIYHIYSYKLGNNLNHLLKQGLEILGIHCQNSTIIMTNGIRKVSQGVDIFDKRILDSCKIHLGQILVHGTNILMLTHRTRCNSLLLRGIFKAISSKIWIQLGNISLF